MNEIYLIFLIVVIVLIIIFVIFNKMTVKNNNVMNASSSIDVMLKKRFDLIPNLVEIVKSNTKHEKEVLSKITELRNKAINSNSKEEMIKTNSLLNNELKSVFVLAENYPKLKSNENYLKLQVLLNDIEEDISAARRTYNAHVTDYNTYISIIPINILALLFGFKKYQQFEIKDEEKENKKWMNDDE